MLRYTQRCDYYSIDAILLDEQPVDAAMTGSVFMLGKYLPTSATAAKGASSSSAAMPGSRRTRDGDPITDASTAANVHDIAQGVRVTVPLWAARTLYEQGVLAVRVPEYFTPAAIDDFKSDASLPSIPERNPYMLELGAQITAYLPSHAAARVRREVLRLFLRRFIHVVRCADAKGHDVSVLREKLSAREMARMATAMKDKELRAKWTEGTGVGSGGTTQLR